MPRSTIKLKNEVEYLSILDAKGNVDEELVPQLEADELNRIFRTMLLARRFDERMLRLQRQGRIGTFAPIQGQEASQVGVAAAMRDDDWLIPSFREAAASIWRGTPLSGILLYAAGYNEGAAIPDGQNDLPIAIPVGSQIPHAVGIALGIKYKGVEAAAVTFFGDGATSTGDFHEAMNFAGVLEAPCVFICQNNQWAISVPRSHQTASATLAQKGIGYGVRSLQVDGNDVLAVYSAASEALERARGDRLPTFIECVTYRMSVHTTADDPSKYRSDDEVEKWKERDPIDRFERYLKQKEILDDAMLKDLCDEIDSKLDDAWQDALSTIEQLDDPRVLFDHHFKQTPENLEMQRELFERRLKERAAIESGDFDTRKDDDDEQAPDEAQDKGRGNG